MTNQTTSKPEPQPKVNYAHLFMMEMNWMDDLRTYGMTDAQVAVHVLEDVTKNLKIWMETTVR